MEIPLGWPVDLEALDPGVIAAALAVLVLLVVVGVLALGRRRARHHALEDRFGSEYRRTVDDARSRRRAEDELVRRAERRRAYETRLLAQAERDDLRARWEIVQASFVDGPESALRAALALVEEVAVTRGYPDEGTKRCLDDVSVDHPELVADLRRQPVDDDRWLTTEHRREAFVHARALFERLVSEGESGAQAATSGARHRDLPALEAPTEDPAPAHAEGQLAEQA